MRLRTRKTERGGIQERTAQRLPLRRGRGSYTVCSAHEQQRQQQTALLALGRITLVHARSARSCERAAREDSEGELERARDRDSTAATV